MKLSILFAVLATAISAEAERCRHPTCPPPTTYTVPLSQVDPIQGQVMSYFGFGNFSANDGTVSYKSCRGLVLNANPYHLYVPPSPIDTFDHVKLALVSNDIFTVPNTGKITLSGTIKTEVFGNQVCKSPYPECVAQEEDLRFASTVFVILDLVKSFCVGFIQTNDRVYAFYERLTLSRQVLGNYAAFMYVVPLTKRCKKDSNKVAVTLDKQNHQVLYSVEGKHKLTVNNVGYVPTNRELLLSDFGGDNVVDFPDTFQYMFACTAFVDFYPACKDLDKCEYPCARMALTSANSLTTGYPMYNPLLGPPYTIQYYDQVGLSQRAHVWGQGAIQTIDDVKIQTFAC